MPSISYDAQVAARTRAAVEILRTKELFSLYEAAGGLREDLEEIRDQGLRAEALSQARSGAKAAGSGATLNVLESFATLQKDYTAVMAVVKVVKHELGDGKAPAEVTQALARILVNEAAVTILPAVPPAAEVTTGATGAKKPKRRAVRSESQEALRAEIQKDAAALLDLKAAHAALGRRKVTLPRLKKLRDDAQALTNQLGERSVKKGAGKAATSELHDAVLAQRQLWGACYSILRVAGQEDQRIRQLLAEAARKR